jgi:hypothetical protein
MLERPGTSRRANELRMKTTPQQQLIFTSKLKNIAAGMEYFAIPVPAAITAKLGTRRAVATYCRVNGSERFAGNLVPWGGGRHYLRVRNQICKSVHLRAGDRVRVEIAVRDRDEEVVLPPDLAQALRRAKASAGFAALSLGKKSFLLRVIDDAVRPETRAKRIQEAVEEAQQRSAAKSHPRRR